MGFARDLGAAMTFGLSVTTKHKKAETEYGNRRKQHEQRLNATMRSKHRSSPP